jgi:outer membrane protein
MAGAARFCATSMIAILAATPVTAADLATPREPLPPPPPIFFVHAGALGAFAETNAQATGGGSFGGRKMSPSGQCTP